MIWIIVCAIIGFVIMYDFWCSFGDGIMGAFCGAFCGFLLYFLIGGLIGCSLPLNQVVEEQEIYALTDNSSVEGVHYLFSGYIDEDLVCRYVVNTDKGKHIEETDVDNVYINEGDYKPLVKHYTYVLEKEWHNLFAHELFTDDYYEFYVPKNTVTNEYNIDLK